MSAGTMETPPAEDITFLAHLENGGQGQLLRDHLLFVSRGAWRNSGKIGIGSAGAAIGLVHDIGKYSRDFQKYLRGMVADQDTEQSAPGRGRIDHSTAGAQKFWRTLKRNGVEGVVGEILALCVASHHSGLIDCLAPGGADNLSRRMNKLVAKSHFDEAWASADQAVIELHKQHVQDPELVGGLRDSIARICQLDQNKTIQQFKIGLLVRFLFSGLIDADHTDTADFLKVTAASLRQQGEYIQWPVLIDLLEQKIGRFSVNTAMDELRRQVSEACLSASNRPKGVFTLTVPTGGGKTLASLRFALNHAAKWNLDRIIYVSPYTSIIDQNAEVVRRILESDRTEFASVVLEHHSNLTPLKQTEKSKVLSQNWDAPVVFTTAVQVLETLFGSGTRAVRRMHQLANSILIFDEIQTLPVRCVHLFNNAVNFLVEQGGSSVVLCTATPPLLHHVDATKGALRLGENSAILENVPAVFAQSRRHEAYDRRKPGGWEDVEAAQFAVLETERAGSCLVVVNTKREARSIFMECRALVRDVLVFHLSTGMCPAHRIEVLAEVKKRLDNCVPVICVSTQLIEAGVDISFGSAIRALAGLDSIAQTAGRCNRHGEPEMGRVHVINLRGELPKALREIRAAQEAAQRVLDENAENVEDRTLDLSNPELIERYFRYYFFERRKEMDYPVGPDRAERDDTLLNMLAENRLAVAGCTPRPPIYLRQAFMTAAEAFQAIDANTRGVIVPYTGKGKAIISELCAAHEPKKQFALLKRAQRFTVDIFPNILGELQRHEAVHEVQTGTGILYLEERYYNRDYGLNVEGTEAMEFQNA